MHREEIAAALLDELRRNLAIDVEYLSDDGFDLVRRLSAQHLKEPWSLPERELPPMAGVAFPGPGQRGQRRSNVYLSGRGQFGRFLIREYASRQDHPEDRRCPGDHHRPVQHAERGRAADGGGASRRARRPGLPAARGGDPLAGRERAVRCRRPGAADPGQRGRPAGQPVLPRAVPGRRRDPGRAARQGAHRPGPARRTAGTRARVQRGGPAGPVLLADHGTRGGHQRAERRRAAQRAADAGQLRSAGRPRGTIRAARAGGDVLRDRQRPRPVLLPAADRYGRRIGRPAPPGPGQRGPGPIARPGGLARRNRPGPARIAHRRAGCRRRQPQPGAPAQGPRAAHQTRLRHSVPLPGSRPCSPE